MEGDLVYLRTGLACTAAADFCLLILYAYMPGILIFCVTQTVYAMRYDRQNKRATLVFLGVSAILITAGGILIKMPALFVAAGIYAVCLGTSVYKSIRLFFAGTYPKANSYMMMTGMILFLLCDINVGLCNILPHTDELVFAGHTSAELAAFCAIILWYFYIPSQILLAASGKSYHAKYADI